MKKLCRAGGNRIHNAFKRLFMRELQFHLWLQHDKNTNLVEVTIIEIASEILQVFLARALEHAPPNYQLF